MDRHCFPDYIVLHIDVCNRVSHQSADIGKLGIASTDSLVLLRLCSGRIWYLG